MRVAIAIVFLYASSWAVPVGYLEIKTDAPLAEVYLDNRLVIVDSTGTVTRAKPGKHFVSLFPPKKVYQAFRDDTPDQFWDALRRQKAISESRRLLSSYERGAVRVGTKWVYAVPDDTVPVRLSMAKVRKTYYRDSSCVLRTFVGWTLLIGAGMIISVIVARWD
ncbi:hypothetical protein CH330_03515 [candidate division WOR-3 bacterium JGI_Cruoil_03_51_56]|uniref:PEGA domain-containing protein n=1 Tax=candidate division WOR-3 bacterium JGI_Cruoil_03_51_56 TaxID=1973747 RepID=A0A235BVE1_UNCW3|nr:MAG: hypothetical protein CH330_03515 [candidate division WOR-3 bacterium JGI_Cruoil_03_51_56]